MTDVCSINWNGSIYMTTSATFSFSAPSPFSGVNSSGTVIIQYSHPSSYFLLDPSCFIPCPTTEMFQSNQQRRHPSSRFADLPFPKIPTTISFLLNKILFSISSTLIPKLISTIHQRMQYRLVY